MAVLPVVLYQFPLEMFADLHWGGAGEQRLSLSDPAPASPTEPARPEPSRHEVPEDPLPHHGLPQVAAHRLQLEDAGQVQVAAHQSEEGRMERELLQQAGALLYRSEVRGERGEVRGEMGTYLSRTSSHQAPQD